MARICRGPDELVRTSLGLIACCFTLDSCASAAPPGFVVETTLEQLVKPTALALAPDGRAFISELAGRVKVVDRGAWDAVTILDIVDEVGASADRGLLGLVLDPAFSTSGYIYLYFVVDPLFGEPNELYTTATFCRLVRYTVGTANNSSAIDPASRVVLLGESAVDGTISCHITHQGGALCFANDGTLFVGAGDGASYFSADAGGNASCGALFGGECNIGAFRAQNLDCLAGKILRIDPATGDGVSDNPYFTGDATDTRSKVWAYGVRNPYRITLRPGSDGVGTLYIGDVGWNLFEELDVCRGGENFGWPCHEGPILHPSYSTLNPANSGCATLNTPDNPGPVTAPVSHWHHQFAQQSSPPGVIGKCIAGAAFYTGHSFPESWSGAFFHADFTFNWLRTMKLDETDALISTAPFTFIGGGMSGPVDIAVDPIDGSLVVLTHVGTNGGGLQRIRHLGPDLNDDGIVNGADLGLMLAMWGAAGSGADLDGNGTVDGVDLGLLLGAWTLFI